MQDSIHQAKSKVAAQSTQIYLRIAEIHDDVVVLKNGGLRSVIEVSSVNVNLKSEEEQNALVYAYQNFLNSLEFPIQIVVRSKRLDVSGYLVRLTEIGKKQSNELLRNQVFEYIEYIRRLVEFADIMQKNFYVVIPYDPPRSKSTTVFQKFWRYLHPADSAAAFRQRKREFGEVAKKLNQRTENIVTNLENVGLKTKRLTTPELIQMFYTIYNPLTARNEKVEEPEKYDLVDLGELSPGPKTTKIEAEA